MEATLKTPTCLPDTRVITLRWADTEATHNSSSSSNSNNNNSNNKTFTVGISPDLRSSKWEVGTGSTHPNNNIGLISDLEDTLIKETNIPNKT
jgi:hypothetical protein